MKIELCQINPVVGDLEGNIKKILSEIEIAKKNDVELVAFPELSTTGYPPKDILYNTSFVIENKALLEKIIANSDKIHLIVGFVDYDSNKKGNDNRIAKYNAAALIGNRQLLGIQHKTLLPTYDVFDEKRYFLPAAEHNIYEVDGKKLGIQICEDLWDQNYTLKVTSILADKGADFIVNISASPFECGKRRIREDLLRKKAVSNRTPMFYVNLVGGQDDLVFDGESLIVDKKGNLIAVGKKFQEDRIYIDFDMKSKIGKPIKNEPYSEVEETYKALVLGLRDYYLKCGFFKGIVLGSSGGIDSAVTQAIATDAIDSKKVLALLMPSPYSSEHSVIDAVVLSKNLGNPYLILPIGIELEAAKKGSGIKQYFDDVTEQNIQARIRGRKVMEYANEQKRLALATGNKSELAVGYCTLYGDMCGGFAILSDVFKTKVYELARYINRKNIIIPQNILEKAPSAELKKDQRDQDDLPPYEVLDGILRLYIEEYRSINDIISTGFYRKTVEHVIAKVNKAEFKRQQMPLGIKITEKAFGSGRQMPIVNKYRG